VSLIEKNPVSKLSGSYQSKLLNKIQQNFTDDEQHLFIASFYCYLNCDPKDFIIDLDNIYEWVGFSRKDHAKRLFLKHFTINIDYKVSLPQLGEQKINDTRGGNNKETILMTIKTFKKLCMKAATKKADEIHDYFIKLEEILQETIAEESTELQMQLMGAKTDIVIEKHLTLLSAYDNRALVYILKVECPNFNAGLFLIKIGATQNIKERIQHISSEFGCKIYALELFPCEDHFAFETFLKDHHFICPLNYKQRVGTKLFKSTECFTVSSNEQYAKIKRIIFNHVSRYYEKNLEGKKLQVSLLKAQNEEKLIKLFDGKPETFVEYMKLLKQPDIKSEDKDDEESKEKDEEDDAEDDDQEEPIQTFKPARGSQGPIVHMYEPTDFSRVYKIIDGITEATREIQGSSFTAIKTASKNKTLFLQYRWFLVDRNDPEPNAPKDIGATVLQQERNTGFIAQLDKHKNLVLKVFLKRGDAAAHISQHPSAMTTAVQFGRPLSGYYFIEWESVDDAKKQTYLNTHTLPVNDVKLRGVAIDQLHPDTMALIKTHLSKADVVKEFHMSPKTIVDVIEKERIYNGFRWKYAKQEK